MLQLFSRLKTPHLLINARQLLGANISTASRRVHFKMDPVQQCGINGGNVGGFTIVRRRVEHAVFIPTHK